MNKVSLEKNKGKKQSAKHKNKVKNYFLLAIIFLVAIGLTVYLCKWYNVYDQYQKQTPVIKDTLTEISPEELEHYIIDSPTAVIYMCTSDELKCRNFEKDFKKLIKNEDLNDQIIYLNLNEINKKKFFKDFNSNYPYKKELRNYPAIVIFEDSKVVKIIQSSNEDLKISKVKQVIDTYKIGE